MNKFLFYFIRLLGLLPIKNVSLPNGKTSLCVSNAYCLLGLTMVSFLICERFILNQELYLHFDIVNNTYPNGRLIRSATSLTTEITAIIVCYLNAVVSLCSAIYGASKFISLVQTLEDVDFNLQKTNSQNFKKTNIILFLAISVFIMLCSYEAFNNTFGFNLTSILLSIGYPVTKIIQLFAKVLFLHVVLNIRARFIILNSRVAQILQNDKKKKVFYNMTLSVVEDFKG